MKSILFLMTVILLTSCGSEEDSYPIVYIFDKSEITESTIYTVDGLGNDVFPNTIFPFTDSGVTQIEFFEQLSLDFPIDKITLIDESKVKVEFNQNVLEQKPIEVSYSDDQEVLVPEFGIAMDGENIYGQACLNLNAQIMPYAPVLEINFCNEDSAIDACKKIYNDRIYQMGDTLALSIQRFIFVKE